MGEGAFRTGKDFDQKDDIFAIKIGTRDLTEGDGDEDVIDIADIKDSAIDSKPVAEEDYDQDDVEGSREYGYGFWMRFLTTYPKRLTSGKNAPWYFVARLTKNVPVKDGTIGDRMLAIW